MVETHYIEAYTRRFNGQEEAICGAYVDPEHHSATPTCPECRRICDEEDAASRRTIALANAEVGRV